VLVVAVAARDRRLVAVLVLGALAALALPQVRERLALLRNEGNVAMGGRRALWTVIGPELIAAHPLGMGWKAPRHEDFRAVSPHVQERLNHLHSNPMEVLLETGWLGLAAWLAWMGRAFGVGAAAVRRTRAAGGAAAALAIGGLGAFTGLMLNGLAEYNFGDMEILMVLLWIMGLLATFGRRGEPA
jgi:O-antigen ligase